MKRIGSILCIAFMMVMMAGTLVFAEDFKIEDTVPGSGAKNTTKENMCVKVIFSSDVGNADSREANKGAFRIVSEDGKEIPSLVYYNKKNPKVALISIDTTKVPETGKDAIQDNTKYICTIDGDFTDNHGHTLGEDKVIEFTTMNQGRDMMVYMIIMVVFMVAMIVFTVIQSRKQLMESAESGDDDGPFNPYKEAKRTGKTVEQVIKEHEKKDGGGGPLAGLLGGGSAEEEDEEDELPEDHYRVKGPRPISAAGSAYKTGRKARAAEEAKKREAEKAERKSKGYAKKSKKKTETKGKGKKKK